MNISIASHEVTQLNVYVHALSSRSSVKVVSMPAAWKV